MTIKQQGGIFGRNPSFNDVEAATVNVDTTTDNAVIGQFSLWNSSQSSQPYLRMAHSLGTSIGSHTAITVNDMLGSVAFAGSTGTAFYDGASVEGKATQTYTGSNGGTKLLFKTTPNGSQTLTEQMVLDQGGDLTISNGNLVIGTSGKGIDFSATAGTGTSELFDDYEEGTWAVVVKDTNSTVVTGVIAAARYTKIGRLVNCTLVWYRNDVASLTGAVTFDLPFASQLTSPYYPAYGTYFAAQGGPTYANISTGVVILDSYADNIGNLKFGYSSGTIGNLSFGAGAENLQNGGAFYSSFSYETTA